jgi:hypothetical protein
MGIDNLTSVGSPTPDLLKSIESYEVCTKTHKDTGQLTVGDAIINTQPS